MSEFLFHYSPVHPTTWVYLSSLLMIGLFFKFGRFWSVRNLDLVLLILLGPGLLLVHFGHETAKQDLSLADRAAAVFTVDREAGDAAIVDVDAYPPEEETAEPEGLQVTPPSTEETPELVIDEDGPDDIEEPLAESSAAAVEPAAEATESKLRGRSIQYVGFVWLLAVCGLLLIRLLLDPTMVRRPLLEPNLSTGGLTFVGCSLLVFLMANVVNSQVFENDLAGPRSFEQLLAGVAEDQDTASLRRHGPGNALLHSVPSLATVPLNWTDEQTSTEGRYVRTAKAMAIISHLAVVFGIVAIGYRHFDNIKMGIGAATLYLMLPYTSQMTGRVDHVLPAALLVWAILCYRRPLPAGMFIGLAIGVMYYPLFLLPLWISFYWQRGLMRFLCGVLVTLFGSVLSLVLVSADFVDFMAKVQGMFGIWLPVMERLQGVWGLGWEPVYRVPVLAAFFAISGAMALWPPEKNLGTLLSCSAAVMVATQFWHGYGGGLYVAWYMPLLLLTIFRPNLEDRVALTVLGEGWFPRRRRTRWSRVGRAA
ncbi:MAG: glycosyltransferase family 87 protein [Pirellulaceae bacterium]